MNQITLEGGTTRSLDVEVFGKTGKPAGLSLSLKLKRPRMPFADRIWSPGNKAYLVDKGYIVEPTHYVPGEPVKLNVYNKPFSSHVMDHVHGLVGAGFYHSRLVRDLWPLAWRIIASSSGLPDYRAYLVPSSFERPESRTMEADVLVVGGGLSGINAALEASRQGSSVILVDDHAELGGFMKYIDPQGVNVLEKKLEENRVKVFLRSKYIGGFMDGHAFTSPGYLNIVKPKSIIFATGGISPIPIYENNDLPGTIDLEYALKISSYMRDAGNILVIGCSQDVFKAVSILASKGRNVKIIRPHGTTCSSGANSSETIGEANVLRVEGMGRVRRAVLDDGTILETDIIVSGLTPFPDLNPALQNGAKPTYIPLNSRFTVSHNGYGSTGVDGLLVAGLAAGITDNECSVLQSRVAGMLAAEHAGYNAEDDVVDEYRDKCKKWIDTLGSTRGLDYRMTAGTIDFWLTKKIEGLQFIDWDIDMTVEDAVKTYDKGYDSMEKIKRFSGIGTAAEQGRLTIPSTIMILSAVRKVRLSKLGWFRIRPTHMLPSIGELAVRW